MIELVERVYALGDDCGMCGDPLEPGDLAIWVEDYGRVHDSCRSDLAPDDPNSVHYYF